MPIKTVLPLTFLRWHGTIMAQDKNPYRCVQNHYCEEQYDGKNCPYDKDNFGGSDNGNKLLKAVNEYSSANNDTLNETGARKLKKGIESHKKRIKEHEEKIKNPALYYTNWGLLSVKQQEGAIKSWQKEIERYKNQIEEKRRKIEEYYGRKRSID